MKLYEITKSVEQAIDCLQINGDGEVSPESMEALNCLQEELEQKVLNIARYIKGLLAEADAIKAEKDRLTKREKAARNKAEWLRGYIQVHIEEGAKYKDETAVIGWRKSSNVVTDHEDYQKYPALVKTTQAWDKTRIKEAIKAGRTLDGLRIVETNNLQIK